MKKALFLAAICCTFLVACNLIDNTPDIKPEELKEGEYLLSAEYEFSTYDLATGKFLRKDTTKYTDHEMFIRKDEQGRYLFSIKDLAFGSKIIGEVIDGKLHFSAKDTVNLDVNYKVQTKKIHVSKVGDQLKLRCHTKITLFECPPHCGSPFYREYETKGIAIFVK